MKKIRKAEVIGCHLYGSRVVCGPYFYDLKGAVSGVLVEKLIRKTVLNRAWRKANQEKLYQMYDFLLEREWVEWRFHNGSYLGYYNTDYKKAADKYYDFMIEERDIMLVPEFRRFVKYCLSFGLYQRFLIERVVADSDFDLTIKGRFYRPVGKFEFERVQSSEVKTAVEEVILKFKFEYCESHARLKQ